ncbi:MAG: polysaccharide deacetylase family protein [Prevotella sp.]|nr:polysaccharide deacetylase family protein [Candidatus Equicola stercoris]
MNSSLYELFRNKFFDLQYARLKKKWDNASAGSKLKGLVIMYHHVTDEHVDILESCQCTVDSFRSTLVRLKSEGYVFVSLDSLMKFIEMKSDKKFAVVTFDDVPDNVYYNAYPILKEMNIPFALFMTVGFIDKDGYLSREQLMELDKDSLCTIGAHTMTHPQLRRVKNSYEEMSESKMSLENILNHPVDYLAYPFGTQSSVSVDVMKEAEKIGFKCAFGTIQTPINDLSSKALFYLPRLVIKH